MSKSEFKRFPEQCPDIVKAIANFVIDECIAVTIEEPEEIRNSASYRQGYVRAINQKAEAMEKLKIK